MIDPYGPEGMALLTGFTKRINGEPRESCTSAEMKLGWDKADEAVTHGIAQPRPPLARLRIPGMVVGIVAVIASSYAVLTHHYAESAPAVATSYVVPDLTSPAVDMPAWDDLGRRFHVMLKAVTPAVANAPAAAAAGPRLDDVLAQLRAVAAARNALRHEHHTAHAAETAPDLLREGDALLEAGDVAAARVLYGRAAEDGTSAIAVQAADRLNQLDAR